MKKLRNIPKILAPISPDLFNQNGYTGSHGTDIWSIFKANWVHFKTVCLLQYKSAALLTPI